MDSLVKLGTGTKPGVTIHALQGSAQYSKYSKNLVAKNSISNTENYTAQNTCGFPSLCIRVMSSVITDAVPEADDSLGDVAH